MSFSSGAHTRLRLFCFPYAGGGASIFRQWAQALPNGIEICPVMLPGRETRLREKSFTRLTPLVEVLAEALQPSLDVPFAFFGHSMGGLLAFETARELRRQNAPQPLHLFLSARPAPQLGRADPPLSHLPDAIFVTELQRRYSGIPAVILQDSELLKLYLPILRADLEMLETYSYSPESRLDYPISTFGGLQDVMVTPDKIAPWREQTTQTFTRKLFPGNHFFLQSQQAALLEAMAGDLTPLLEKLNLDPYEESHEHGF
jgi:medium-chain acyl-[acyl-carrier-protein] hydrolase